MRIFLSISKLFKILQKIEKYLGEGGGAVFAMRYNDTLYSAIAIL